MKLLLMECFKITEYPAKTSVHKIMWSFNKFYYFFIWKFSEKNLQCLILKFIYWNWSKIEVLWKINRKNAPRSFRYTKFASNRTDLWNISLLRMLDFKIFFVYFNICLCSFIYNLFHINRYENIHDSWYTNNYVNWVSGVSGNFQYLSA